MPRWAAERVGRANVVRRTLSHFVYVGRDQTLDAKTEHIFPNRGRLIIKDFELSTNFPFGFFNHRRRLAARKTELIVFPRYIPFTDRLDEMPLDAGKIVANKRGAGHDLLALRNYRPNDDLRSIDWKATARAQMLTVREFAADDDRRVTVILDDRLQKDAQKMPTLREKLDAEQAGRGTVVSERFENGVRLAAAIICRFADENASIRLIIGRGVGEFGTGRGHLSDCLTRLAVADPLFIDDILSAGSEPALEVILEERSSSHYYFVTATGTKAISPIAAQQLNVIEF